MFRLRSYAQILCLFISHLKNNTTKNYDSKDLIKDFLNSGLKLYTGIEITLPLQSICAAANKISVESDVESLVPRYENHWKNTKLRSLLNLVSWMVDKWIIFLIRSVQVFYKSIFPVYTPHLFVIVMWLYSLSFKPITPNPYILGPTHPPRKCAYEILEPKLPKIMHNDLSKFT